MTIFQAEKQVRLERRRKKKALPGYKSEAAYRLKQAVTRALEAAAARTKALREGSVARG